jgi:hypothetical protein
MHRMSGRTLSEMIRQKLAVLFDGSRLQCCVTTSHGVGHAVPECPGVAPGGLAGGGTGRRRTSRNGGASPILSEVPAQFLAANCEQNVHGTLASAVTVL